MPQKRNADSLELIRGIAGSLFGQVNNNMYIHISAQTIAINILYYISVFLDDDDLERFTIHI